MADGAWNGRRIWLAYALFSFAAVASGTATLFLSESLPLFVALNSIAWVVGAAVSFLILIIDGHWVRLSVLPIAVLAIAAVFLFPDVDALEKRMGSRYPYGLTNTPTIEALTDAIDLLEESAGTVLVPSGLAAVTLPILAFASPGMRLLIPDNVYCVQSADFLYAPYDSEKIRDLDMQLLELLSGAPPDHRGNTASTLAEAIDLHKKEFDNILAD